MVINKFFREVLVSSLNPVHIPQKQFQRPEETTLNSPQLTAKQAPQDHISNSLWNLARKELKERWSFSSHSSKQIFWPLCYKGGLPWLTRSPSKFVSELILNKFHQTNPLLPLIYQIFVRSHCSPQTFIQMSSYRAPSNCLVWTCLFVL